MELEELSQKVQKMYRSVLDEVRLTRVGLKDSSEIAAIYEQYPELIDAKTIEAAKRGWKHSKGEDAERWRILFFFCQGLSLEKNAVKLGDELLSELMRQTVELDGEEVPYFALRNVLVNEPASEKREVIYDRLMQATEKTNPLRKKIMSAELAGLKSETGSGSITEYIQQRKQIEYAPLLEKLQQALVESGRLYQHHMGRWAKETLGKPLGELSRAHQGYLMKMPKYDELFPGKDLLLVCRQTLENLGCNLASIPQIKIDDTDRPKKNPRASCIATDPPSEVYLIIKPVGGADDYHAFLHEAGHALHFALLDPSLPYEQRSIGTSHALTEVYSFLLESLTRNPLWLRQYLGIGEELAWEVSYYSMVVDLAMFRRYVSKLQYELQFYENPTAWERNANRYKEILSKNTGFVYRAEAFLDDIDGGLYSANYLRAWITSAQLREYLSKEYGDNWFLSSEAGVFLKSLWKKGLSIENEDVSKMIGAQPFDTSALLKEYHDVLTSNPV